MFIFKKKLADTFLLTNVKKEVKLLQIIKKSLRISASRLTFLMDIHLSATTIYRLTGEVKNIDYLITVAPVSWWDILGSKCPFVPEINVLEAEKIGKCKALSDFDRSQIVMARRSKSFSKSLAG